LELIQHRPEKRRRHPPQPLHIETSRKSPQHPLLASDRSQLQFDDKQHKPSHEVLHEGVPQTQTPYFAFILGVILLQGYSRKNIVEDKKKLAEIASYLFLFYAKNRSRDAQQEIYYNIGRMYHQLGVMYLAQNYYLKVLELKETEPSNILGLKYEAAYNLHLIYKNSGNMIAARNVVIKHMVI
jgi:tetratricopeptide (TPR) repeat protein